MPGAGLVLFPSNKSGSEVDTRRFVRRRKLEFRPQGDGCGLGLRPDRHLIAVPSRSLDVAKVAQVDMTWDLGRLVQVYPLCPRTFAGQCIRSRGFDYYRVQITARW